MTAEMVAVVECIDCHTPGGAKAPFSNLPWRKDGRCSACWNSRKMRLTLVSGEAANGRGKQLRRADAWEMRREPRALPVAKQPNPPKPPRVVAPCTSCGTTGGPIPDERYRNPVRIHGMCRTCYAASNAYAANRGQLTPTIEHPNPIPSTTMIATGRMFWEGNIDGVPQHAIYGTRERHASATTEAEAFAARWMARHPEQVRADMSSAVFLFGGGA